MAYNSEYPQHPYTSNPYKNQPVNLQPIKSQLILDGTWSSGLCDCLTDSKSCCLAFWCFPCFLCCLDQAAKECCCTTICSCAGLGMLRSKIRGIYKIRGSIIEDCCCMMCCTCCTALQIYRELQYRGEIKD